MGRSPVKKWFDNKQRSQDRRQPDLPLVDSAKLGALRDRRRGSTMTLNILPALKRRACPIGIVGTFALHRK